MRIKPTLVDYLCGHLLHRRYREHTMIGRRAYAENIALCRAQLRDPRLAHGAIAECGTWRGGMAAGLIEIGGPERDYYFFDSFAGLPPAQEIDGADALAWQAGRSGRGFHDNCAATIEEFHATLARAKRLPAALHIHKGLFEETFPLVAPTPIAILRLDGDWYASTVACLEKFWDLMLPGGLILIDDYYDWDGCSRAVHDFLSRRSAPERILQGPRAGVCVLVKAAHAS